MANFRRRSPRASTYSNTNSMNSWPRWWDITFNTRPKRRRNHARLARLNRDPSCADEITFDPGNHKPHQYYW